ncbi:MAG: SDR family oxidoreductase [Saprospiraceae bacterium]|nr:SDR family oxidoreductase [Saprospiraceae bacterium]
MDLIGKTALITGGSKGIGLGVAEALLESGMNIVITGRSHNSIEKAITNLATEHPGKIVGFVADVRSEEIQRQSVAFTLEKFASLDVLIANAGVGHFASIEDLTAKQWNEVIDINLTGVFHSVKACIPALKESKGYIITIASLAGTNFFAGGAAYNASKFGLVGFTQAVMLDLRQTGIKTSTIMPGSVATHFNDRVPSEKDAWKIQPEDIGQIVVDLLRMPERTLPSKVEVRPSIPPKQ